ncbi:MAG: HAD family phosphatase [Clostridia bacterium]|nr:HAD family phosphatase [Clostridia bacterium]
MGFKGAIFDMDGTLIDSMPIWKTICADYLKSIGYIPEDNLYKQLISMDLLEAGEYFRERYGVKQSVDEICRGINSMLMDFYSNRVKTKPGLHRYLEKLRQGGVKLCVATATDRVLAEAAFKNNGILEYFEGIITCGEAGAGKSSPDIYIKALDIIGTEKADTMIFEDALHAAWTAKKAGFRVTGIYDAAAEGQHEQIKMLCDRYVSSWEDLL